MPACVSQLLDYWSTWLLLLPLDWQSGLTQHTHKLHHTRTRVDSPEAACTNGETQQDVIWRCKLLLWYDVPARSVRNIISISTAECFAWQNVLPGNGASQQGNLGSVCSRHCDTKSQLGSLKLTAGTCLECWQLSENFLFAGWLLQPPW